MGIAFISLRGLCRGAQVGGSLVGTRVTVHMRLACWLALVSIRLCQYVLQFFNFDFKFLN